MGGGVELQIFTNGVVYPKSWGGAPAVELVYAMDEQLLSGDRPGFRHLLGRRSVCGLRCPGVHAVACFSLAAAAARPCHMVVTNQLETSGWAGKASALLNGVPIPCWRPARRFGVEDENFSGRTG